MKTYKTSGCSINKIETTSEKISSRGGLLPIIRYIEKSGFIDWSAQNLSWLKKNNKGVTVPSAIRQIIAAMIDGNAEHVSHFDQLRKDPTWLALLEIDEKSVVSSSAIKRLLKGTVVSNFSSMRKALHHIFLSRLRKESPDIIVLDIDTMVLNNEGAKKRHGCKPTYKKVCGFQPLQVTWNGMMVDALFRNGSANSNHGNDVQRVLKKLVKFIRKEYKEDVSIIVTTDSGFMDQKLFDFYMKELDIFFCCNGKSYASVTEKGDEIFKKSNNEYSHKKSIWKYCEFFSALDSWKIEPLRTIYTKCICESNGQYVAETGALSSVIYTNIEEDSGLLNYSDAQSIIELAHSRGKSELTNRSFKEFMGTERFPFKQFSMNGIWYYLQAIAHALLECFKCDVLLSCCSGISRGSYPNMIRRRFIDVGMKLVKGGGVVKAKVHESIASKTGIIDAWLRCNALSPFIFSTS